MELLILHLQFILAVVAAVFLAWIAYRLIHCCDLINCDEDETEANAMTPGREEE